MKDNKNESIEYLKSGISINSQLGCNIGCKYCIVGEFQKSIEKTYSPENVINELVKNRFYHENIPLLINNRSEPLFPELKNDTVNFLRILKDRGIKNPKIVISKLPYGAKDIDVLNDNNVFIFRTISGMPSDVEPTSKEKNIKTILDENLYLKSQTDAKLIHYWRPIVRNLNSSDEKLEDIFTKVCSSCDGSIVSGIRVTPNIKLLLEGFGADLNDWNNDTNHKFLPADIWNKILGIRAKIKPDYLLFRHTSCIISHFRNIADYNLHYAKLKNHQNCSLCPSYSKCHNQINIIDKDILMKCFSQLGRKFEFEISNNNAAIIKTPIYQDELSFIKMVTQYKVEAIETLKSGSERTLANV